MTVKPSVIAKTLDGLCPGYLRLRLAFGIAKSINEDGVSATQEELEQIPNLILDGLVAVEAHGPNSPESMRELLDMVTESDGHDNSDFAFAVALGFGYATKQVVPTATVPAATLA